MSDHDIMKAALGEVCEEELRELFSKAEMEQEHGFSEGFNEKMDRLVKRRSRSYFALVSTAGRRVACIALAVLLLSASALSVGAIRDPVLSFVTRVFTDSPRDEGKYHISDLPQGFELTESETEEGHTRLKYSGGGNFIIFDQYKSSEYFDRGYGQWTGEADENLQDGDREYHVKYIAENNAYSFQWRRDGWTFIIYSDLEKGRVLRLCRSVKER